MRSHRRLALGLIAGAGVAAAHAAAYFVVAPSGHVREHVLGSTGHAYWALVPALAVGALAAGFGLSLLGGRSDGMALSPSVARLAGAQVTIFVAVEWLERAIVDVPSHHALAEPAVQIGILFQVAAAVAAARLFRAGLRLGARLRASPSFPASTAEASLPAVAAEDILRLPDVLRRPQTRAPPAFPA